MLQIRVKVKLLNKRKVIPSFLPDPNNIVGVVRQYFTFEGEEITDVPNKALGKWYKDRDGHFYWEGGVDASVVSEVNLPKAAVDKRKDWGFIDFKIDELWKLTKGEGVQVAILDSGLNFNLDDFKNKSNITYYNSSLNSEKKEECLDDSGGHGTDCAGILCGQGNFLFGVAPAITLNVVKITDVNGIRTTGAILKGMEKAIALNSNIISLSFRIAIDENFDKIHDIIKKAYDKGITVVAAVGDSGSKPKPADNFPASFPECISVGGIDKNKRRSLASSKSNFLDIMAPGENLFSLTTPDAPVSGTSFSTPFTAGVIALLKSFAKKNNKSLSNIELFDILRRSSDVNIPDYNRIEYGWGIINPVMALNFLRKK